MALIPAQQNLFIVDLTYTASFDRIDPLLEAHVEFLKRNYVEGRFIASGPKVPRTGGVIIATAESRDDLEAVLEADPFRKNQVALYDVTEFRPSMTADKLKD